MAPARRTTKKIARREDPTLGGTGVPKALPVATTTAGRRGRQAILDAALRVASRDGLMAMTLDHVAREAGVSKGGLIYHFASKDDLVRGMIAHFSERIETAVIRRIAEDPIPSGRLIRAMVGTILGLGSEGGTRAEPDTQVGGAELNDMAKFQTTLLAAFAVNPRLLEPLLPLGQRMRQRILQEDSDPIDAMITWLAFDGLFVWQVFGMMSPDDPLLSRIHARLRDRVAPRGGGGAKVGPRRPRRGAISRKREGRP